MRFRREVIRDAAYSGLPYRLRRQLHAEVARAIEAKATDVDTRAETLSLHYYLAGIAGRVVAVLDVGRRSSPGPQRRL